MRTLAAGKFTDVCLKLLDEVGDPFGTGEAWHADAS